MSKTKQLDPNTVAWHAPETLNQEAIASQLAAATTAEEVSEILASRPTTGEYRILESTGPVEAEDGTTAIGETYGDRAVFVVDDEDGNGHFEVYKGEDDAYKPIQRLES